MSVLVVLEQQNGKWNRMSFEALAAGQKIAQSVGAPLEAAILGAGIAAVTGEAAQYGVAKVYSVDHALLADYTPDGYTAALEQLIRSKQPKYILFPHTYQVRDFAPKLATRFGRPFASDVVDIKTDGVRIEFVRQLFQGKLNADVAVEGEPQFASVQAGAFRAQEAQVSAAPVEPFAVNLDASQIRSKPEQPFREAQRSVDLGAADVIVSVGRGIKEKDNLPVVEALAEALGAELAASRPICDNGWLPMERQVGSSGQTVAPKVYFAVGISGAIQHLVGMKGSKVVVAINKDENAPIFESADYGVVGDLFEVVPALVEEIKKAKA
ncbi:MAG TPA: electron transfer flavoprotein subunit alpha/FixB family protein [Bryobacteraceae bacterium]|nr:electron transfer flavoprotein subunit alpha/FixB family protein [Bryobacteraceae bacterium]